jgi:hypothetical protein
MTMTELLPPATLDSADGFGTVPESPAASSAFSEPVCRCLLSAFGRCPTQGGPFDRAREA